MKEHITILNQLSLKLKKKLLLRNFIEKLLHKPNLVKLVVGPILKETNIEILRKLSNAFGYSKTTKAATSLL